MNQTSTKIVPTDEDRHAIFRALHAWTGNRQIADDLTQQTLIEAWKSNRQPTSTEWRPWLFGVARNMLLRWRRDLARDVRRSITIPESDSILAAAGDHADFDSDLEQQEIVQLLHELLDNLSADTREVLLLKYIQELPQAEIAKQLGLNEKALEGRLHRGKQKLKTHLLTFRPETALSLGIVSEPNTWQSTDIWCTTCGMQRLRARWSESGQVSLECQNCIAHERSLGYSAGILNSQAPFKRPSFGRLMRFFRDQTEKSITLTADIHQPCGADCNGSLGTTIDRTHLYARSGPVVSRVLKCDTCDFNLSFENVFDAAIDTRQGHHFLQMHPRVEAIQPTITAFENARSVQSGWRSLSSSAEFLAWYDADSGQLIHTEISSG